MSCLCDAYKSEIPEASITKTGAIADVNSDLIVGEDKPYEWKCGGGKDGLTMKAW